MSSGEPSGLIRRLLPYMTLLLVVVVAYTGWTFYSRRAATRAMQERTRQQQSNPLPAEYLSDKVKILSYTIAPAVIRRGQSAELCDSVLNAKTVRFDPPFDDLTGEIPADDAGRTHCTPIDTRQTTSYKLTATAANGSTDSASLTIVVH